jgi:hypothetical protein
LISETGFIDSIMNRRSLLRFLYAAILLAGLVFVYRAWRSWGHATIVIEWSTASEMDTAGFNLYRSQSEAGPWQRINQSLIPGSDDPLTGGSYQYEDHQVAPGLTYYYMLEDVDTSGATSREGPRLVQARRSGLNDAFLALIMIVTGAFGWLSLRAAERNVPQPAASQSGEPQGGETQGVEHGSTR